MERDWKSEPVASIYRHSDGDPEGAGTDIYRFLAEVERQTSDTRFSVADYLAAKYVVYLAHIFAQAETHAHYLHEHGQWPDQPQPIENPLDFLSVGITSDPYSHVDIEYVYYVECSDSKPGLVAGYRDRTWPTVTCYAARDGRAVGEPIPIPRLAEA